MSELGRHPFDAFRSAFEMTPPTQNRGKAFRHELLDAATGYSELAEFAGFTFSQGLYRIHDADSTAAVLPGIAEGFPQYANRVAPFGFDWLGRQFVVDGGRLRAREPLVTMLDPGAGKPFNTPCSLVEFHESELVRHHDAALSSSRFEQWATRHGGEMPLGHRRCVGYKLPLFLGGQDVVENLELTDIEVYWYLHGQLIAKVAGLPAGTRISGVRSLPLTNG